MNKFSPEGILVVEGWLYEMKSLNSAGEWLAGLSLGRADNNYYVVVRHLIKFRGPVVCVGDFMWSVLLARWIEALLHWGKGLIVEELPLAITTRTRLKVS